MATMSSQEYVKSLDDAAWKKAQDVQSWDGMNEVAAPQFIVNSSPYTHAYPGTPEDRKSFEEAIGRYNSQTLTADDPWAGTILSLNNYFEQGQAAPGKLSMGLADSAFKQWDKDSSPGFMDKFMEAALPVAGAVVTSGALGGFSGTASLSNVSIEKAIEQAGISAAKNAAVQFAITGEINPKGVIAAGAGGFAGEYAPVIKDSPIASAAVKGATVGGTQAAVGGGDIGQGLITGTVTGATGAAVKPLVNTVMPDADNWAKGGFAGVISGIARGVVTGGDVLQSAAGGAISGAVSEGLKSQGVGDVTSGIIGSTIAGAATKTDTTNINTTPVTPTVTPPTVTPPTVNNGMVGGFSAYIKPQFIDLPKTRDLSKVLVQPTGN